MTISLTSVVFFILYLLIAAAVIGLLWWLLGFVGSKIPGPPGQMVTQWGRVIRIVLLVVVLISFLLSLLGGPSIRVGP